jgi:hypothetical protein
MLLHGPVVRGKQKRKRESGRYRKDCNCNDQNSSLRTSGQTNDISRVADYRPLMYIFVADHQSEMTFSQQTSN